MKSKFIKKVIILLILVPLVSTSLKAQKYIHSAGIRAGFSSGIAYKGFFDREEAIGVDALYNRNGLNVTFTYQYHIAPFRNDRYMFYIGGGPFGGDWDGDYSIGVCGIAGFEFVVRDLPLLFSVDWKPLFNIIKQTSYEVLDFGLSLRYRFEI